MRPKLLKIVVKIVGVALLRLGLEQGTKNEG